MSSISRLIAASLIALCAMPVHAGLVVVSGDENITNALVGAGTSINAGNQRFFSNLLGTGTHVLIDGTDVGGVDTPVANTNAYFNALGGVTSSIQSGDVTSASLAGINLFVSAIPATAYTPAEIAAIGAFSAGGGTLFLMGDAGAFAASQDIVLNALLVGIGSSLRIVPDNIDAGFRTVGSSQIGTDALTAGVTSFTYTFVSQVSGGTSLFTASGGQTFIASAGQAVTPPVAGVPEPAGVLLLGLGLVAAVGVRRKAGLRGKARRG